jgi:RNA polymerase sigma-70 factor (ECF subfamily)
VGQSKECNGFLVTFWPFPRYTTKAMSANLSPLDPALIECARRDPEAFSALYRRYLTPVYRYLYRRLGNVHDAEDIAAQVFTEALEGLVAGRYHEGGRFPAWLFSIAAHKLTDFYRTRSHLELDDPVSAETGWQPEIEKNDDWQHLVRLLAQMEEEKQELLRLRFSAGLSFSEIAMLDGRSEAAVKMTIYRSLAWLREHWEAVDG